MKANSVAVARAFVEAINRQDADEIASLMAEDHVFIDSDGAAYRGKEQMHAGWKQYFTMFPDYSITVEETYSRGPVVVMVGRAEGTYAVDGKLLDENHWRVPAVWRAVLRNQTVLEWRVYVNVEPILKVMSQRRQGPAGERATR